MVGQYEGCMNDPSMGSAQRSHSQGIVTVEAFEPFCTASKTRTHTCRKTKQHKQLTVRVVDAQRVHDRGVEGESPADRQQAQEGGRDLAVAQGAADLVEQFVDRGLGKLRGAHHAQHGL